MRTPWRLFVVLSALVTIVAFQNCSPMQTGESASPSNEALKPTNNGEGYTGKAYYNLDTAGVCGGASAVMAAIQEVDGRFYQTVKDCKSQTPEDVTGKISAASYNSNALFSSTALFENLDGGQSSYSDIVCRGESTHVSNGRRAFADVSMQPTDQTQTGAYGNTLRVFKGYLKVGLYDSTGALIAKEEFAIEKSVEQITPVMRIFVLDPDEVIPKISMAPPTSSSSTPVLPDMYHLSVKDDSATFVFKAPGMSEPFSIPTMNCRQHGK